MRRLAGPATRLAAAVILVAPVATSQQTPVINVTITVPKPVAEWQDWGTDPSIAMVVVQTTLKQPISVRSTVSLLKDGKPFGEVPANIDELPAGTRLIRAPQLAPWSRMNWRPAAQDGGPKRHPATGELPALPRYPAAASRRRRGGAVDGDPPLCRFILAAPARLQWLSDP